MAITLSYLNVTPTWASKKLTIDGSVAVRESVEIGRASCSSYPLKTGVWITPSSRTP